MQKRLKINPLLSAILGCAFFSSMVMSSAVPNNLALGKNPGSVNIANADFSPDAVAAAFESNVKAPGERYSGIERAAAGRLSLSANPQAMETASGDPGSRLSSKFGLGLDVVRSAFESTLTNAGVGLATTVDPAASKRLNAPNDFAKFQPAQFQPVEIASALGLDNTAIFRETLKNAPQLPLTPTISVNPKGLVLSANVGAATSHQVLTIGSLGSAPAAWNASLTFANGNNWISIAPPAGSTDTNPTLGVDVNYGALGSTPNVYQAAINFTDPATGFQAAPPVPVVVSLSGQQGRIQLSQSSFVFSVAGGGANPLPQNLTVYNAGQGNLNWSILPSSLPSWLSITPSSGTAGNSPFSPFSATLSINSAAAQQLNTGTYQALIPLSGPGASNDPQLISVTLDKVPGSAFSAAQILPNGLLFTMNQGGSAPAPQPLTVSNSGGGNLTGQLSSVADLPFKNWLNVSAPNPSSTVPFTAQVSIDPTQLPAGTSQVSVYHGIIHGAFSAGVSPDVDVYLVVAPAGTLPQTLGLGEPRPTASACTAQSLVMVSTTIGNGATVKTSFPTVLNVTVVDSCGSPVTDATVVANVPSGPISLLSLNNGTYTGTVVPAQPGTTTITFTAQRAGLTSAMLSFTVSAVASPNGTQLPVLFSDGVVEGAGFTPKRPLAPGSIVSLFGSRLAPQLATSLQVPLNTTLAGTSVQIGNLSAPLYYVSDSQINAQVPFEVVPGSSVSIVVTSNGLVTAPQNYLIAPAEPGIFVAGNNAAVLVNDSSGTPHLVTPDNPAHIGDVLQIFANGLGNTNPAAATGAASPSFSTVTNPVQVSVAGVDAPVVYQGLAPGFVGLYQVNATLSAGVPGGDSVPIVITQNGVTSNPTLFTTIPISIAPVDQP